MAEQIKIVEIAQNSPIELSNKPVINNYQRGSGSARMKSAEEPGDYNLKICSGSAQMRTLSDEGLTAVL